MSRTGGRIFKEIYVDNFKVDLSIVELKKREEPSFPHKQELSALKIGSFLILVISIR